RGRVRSGTPADVIGQLGAGPPVTRLGRMLGWDPLPLTVRAARALAATGAHPMLPPPDPAGKGHAHRSVLAEVRGLRATYGETTVLRELDLDLHEGEILAVMGRNGAGKSTLLRVLAGIHEPAGGHVRVRGTRPRPGVDTALCPQEADALLFNDSVEQEVRATLAARGEAGDTGPWLAALGIADLAARHPRDLSAGQRLLEAGAGGVREAGARERLTVVVPGLRIVLLVLANVIGLLAFTWPFLLPSVAGRVAENHQGDGPWIVAALGAILLALLFLELGRGGLGPKTIALLGVLGAAMVALRLPGFVAGFSALFIVVLVAGNSLGPGFGFLLGCVGMFASGIFAGWLVP